MSAALTQIATKTKLDKYLTNRPEVTFFADTARRAVTNFSIETRIQTFGQDKKLTFGRKTSCIISKTGDLLSNMTLVLIFPNIKKFISAKNIDRLTKISYIKDFAYAAIKNIQIDIGGKVIDVHTGEWMNHWSYLYKKRNEQFEKMIGNQAMMLDYTNGKDQCQVYIPLYFWFTRHISQSIPLIALDKEDIIITVEMNNFSDVTKISPTHYIIIENTIVTFEEGTIICQIVNGVTTWGEYVYFDISTQKLYYNKISQTLFISQTINTTTLQSMTNTQRITSTWSVMNQQYKIFSPETGAFVYPKYNTSSITHSYSIIGNLELQDAYLLVDYVYLEPYEKEYFRSNKLTYIIETLQYIDNKLVTTSNASISIPFTNSIKLLLWTFQYNYYINQNNDYYNYTDNPYIKILETRKYQSNTNKKYQNYINTLNTNNNSLVISENILFNGQDIISFRNYRFYNYVQPLYYANKSLAEGVNLYSFCINPIDYKETGTCNADPIKNMKLNCKLTSNLSSSNPVTCKIYGLGYDVLEIEKGISKLLFSKLNK